MEEPPFTTENIINFTLDFHKLSGSLNLLFQFHRTNSSAIEILKKSITDLTTSTSDLKNSLTTLSASFQSLETFKNSSQIKQKNLETQLNSIESLQTQAIKSLESKLPEISNQVLTELENLKNDQSKNLQQIKSSIQNKLKKSKTSILQSVELSRIEASDQLAESKFERENSENFENLSSRVGNVEDRLKRISFDDIFEKIENRELNQRILSKDPEEREDLLGELNLKYVQVIGEVGKLRELLRSFARAPKEESIVVPVVGYSTYAARISELEMKIKVMDEQFRDMNKPLVPRTYSPAYINKRKTYTDYKVIENKIQENSVEMTDFNLKFEELLKKLSEKVSIWDLDKYFKENIEKLIGIQENTIQNIESRIFKDLIDRSESIKTDSHPAPQEIIELIPQSQDLPELKSIMISINNTLGIHQATTLEELQRFSLELKNFEAKINKFSTNLQVQDLRTQDLQKRQQHFEDFQQEITSHIQKLQDRLKKNTLKSTEDQEKTLTHLQELEKLRSNVQEIIHKVQEGNKLHKRDYNTIQELKQLLDSKTSKEEIDQKVDKNELKKMFRNLSKKIDRVQSDLKQIEEVGVNDSIKKLEEPFITTRKLSSECLACGRDLSLQNKSTSKLPSQYKQLPGFSKILPVLTSTFESSRRLKTERFSISVHDPEGLPNIGRGFRN